VSAVNELFRRLLVDAGHRHGERSGKQERTRFVAAKADLRDDFDVAIGEMAASLAADVKESILKASGITAGEELLRIGRITFTSERLGRPA